MIRRRTVLATLAMSISAMTLAATSRAYDPITWHSLDGGGAAFVTAGDYRLGGTIGQPDAGLLAGGAFALRGGFWFGGQAPMVGVGDDAPAAIAFRFYRAPNPIRSQFRAAFDIPSAERVGFSVFDVAGRPVRQVDLGRLSAGHHERIWSAVDDGGRRLPSGVYFLRLVAGREQATQKVLIVR